MAAEKLVETVLEVQLGSLCLHGLHLDRNVLIVVQILSEPQLTKVATANFLPNPEVGPNHEHS